MLSGTIRFSRLTVFKAMEGEQWIGDKLENTSEVKIDHYHLEEATPEAIQKWNETFAPPGVPPLFGPAPGAKNITIRGGGKIRYLGGDDPYIFCVSIGNLDKLTETMCGSAVDPKDACVRIKDIHLLTERILKEGKLLEFDGTVAFKTRVEKIHYTKVSATQGEPLAPLGGFSKDIAFKDQCEIRIGLLPITDDKLPATINFQIPRPHQLLREAFRNYSKK